MSKKPELKDLPGLGSKLEEKLREAGVKTVLNLSRAKADKLAAKVDGLSESRAETLIAAAQGALPSDPAPKKEAKPKKAEPKAEKPKAKAEKPKAKAEAKPKTTKKKAKAAESKPKPKPKPKKVAKKKVTRKKKASQKRGKKKQTFQEVVEAKLASGEELSDLQKRFAALLEKTGKRKKKR